MSQWAAGSSSSMTEEPTRPGQVAVGDGQRKSPPPAPSSRGRRSIFVPLLQQNTRVDSPTAPATLGQKKFVRRSSSRGAEKERKEEEMMSAPRHGCARWTRQTIGLTMLLSLLFLSCAFALLHSEEATNEDSNGGEREELTEEDVKNYLNRFGYIGEPTVVQADEQNSPFISIRWSTSDATGTTAPHSRPIAGGLFAGIPQIGHSALPGVCGSANHRAVRHSDTEEDEAAPVRHAGRGDDSGRGESTAFKWRKRQLTYRVDHFSSDLPQYMQKKALQMAFEAWSRHIPLEFSETSSSGQADIRVRFARGSHGDPWPFDGKGGVLAHATFPSDGQLHFDDDERWAFMDGSKIASHRYTDLFWVSLHEIGHVLGLSHSKVDTAIMAPFYRDPDEMVDWRGNYKTPELTSYDIRAAQEIYGRRTSSSSSSSNAGVGSRRNGNSGGTGSGRKQQKPYDDSEGGFLNRLGKFLTGGSDDSDDEGAASAADGDGYDRSRGRQSHTGGRKSQRNQPDKDEEEDEEDEDSFGGFFSSASTRKEMTRWSSPLVIASLMAILFQAFALFQF